MKLTFIEHDGSQHELDINSGMNIMEAATQNGINGIEAECGGSCMCATCHCYIDQAFVEKLPEISETENDLLDCTASERLPNSRLGCQVVLTDELDGIKVTLPEHQS